MVDSRLWRYVNDAPVVSEGTPGKARPKILQARWQTDKKIQQRLATRKRVVRMSPKRIQNGIVKALNRSRQAGVKQLFSELMRVTMAKRLLIGFSSAAIVGGCLCLTYEALDEEFVLFRPYFRAALERAGLEIGQFATIEAYTQLFRERGQLQEVLAELGVQVDDLHDPKWAMKWEIHLIEERRRDIEQREEEL